MHKNLQLALLDNLMEDGVIQRFDRNAFFLKYRSEPFDPNCDYNFEPLPDVEAYLLRIELKDSDLAQLTAVSVDPGQRLQQDIFPQWDGEDNYFDVPSLEGLQRCTNAKQLHLELFPPNDPGDIEALRRMPGVENITFNGGVLDDLGPLDAIACLRKVEFLVTRIKDTQENRIILENLRRRGCKVANKGMKFE